MKDKIISGMLGNTKKLIELLETHIKKGLGAKVPYFMTCDECGKDYLVDDGYLPEPDIKFQTICRRCFELYHRDAELEEQRRDAYRQAKERM